RSVSPAAVSCDTGRSSTWPPPAPSASGTSDSGSLIRCSVGHPTVRCMHYRSFGSDGDGGHLQAVVSTWRGSSGCPRLDLGSLRLESRSGKGTCAERVSGRSVRGLTLLPDPYRYALDAVTALGSLRPSMTLLERA